MGALLTTHSPLLTLATAWFAVTVFSKALEKAQAQTIDSRKLRLLRTDSTTHQEQPSVPLACQIRNSIIKNSIERTRKKREEKYREEIIAKKKANWEYRKPQLKHMIEEYARSKNQEGGLREKVQYVQDRLLKNEDALLKNSASEDEFAEKLVDRFPHLDQIYWTPYRSYFEQRDFDRLHNEVVVKVRALFNDLDRHGKQPQYQALMLTPVSGRQLFASCEGQPADDPTAHVEEEFAGFQF